MPGPKILLTGLMAWVPNVRALIAWAPPTKYVSLIPNSLINLTKYGLIDLVLNKKPVRV